MKSPCLFSTGVLTGLLASSCAREAEAGGPLWVDVSSELALAAPEAAWPDGTFFLPEIMAGGVGLFDSDGDGTLDLLHVRVPPPGDPEGRIANRLYRRPALGAPFEDVTGAAGLERPGYGQGLAVGDIDNDGDLDVYVTNYGPDVLWRNAGDGRFTDATAGSGLERDEWSIAAAFGDYDDDGYQDLYVVHYLRFDPGKPCSDTSGRRDYCGPFVGAPDALYHNEGGRAFSDRSKEAGIVLPQRGTRATGLGIAFLDLSGDGRLDVFVANDGQANQLWVNQGDGTFVDQGIQRGLAYSYDGRTEAGMGVAVGDVDGDGSLDLFVTHLWQENNRLFLGGSRHLFRDGTIAARLPGRDLERTGFGCALFDSDHDGDVDLALVNGAVSRRPPEPGAPAGFWGAYAEPNQVFENQGAGVFVPADEKTGTFATNVEVSRGLALGDLDEDGDLDLVLSNADNTLRVYRNDAPRPGSHWLLVRALAQGRDALGAEVRVRAGGREFVGAVLAASSYGSSNDPRVHFGLGPHAEVEALTVRWPGGATEVFPGGPADRVVSLRRGEGRVP